MAKKKKTKTKKETIIEQIKEEKQEPLLQSKVSKNIENQENYQLIWFFAIIIIVFASFLVPYFYAKELKRFDYAGASWQIEDYNGQKIFHGRFTSFYNNESTHNLFLRNDPRKNNVTATGTFKEFASGGFISLTPEIDACRGEVSRIMLDLGSFLKSGIGLKVLAAASSDEETANQTNRAYVTCNNSKLVTSVMITIGTEQKVYQSVENPFCYTIQVTNCQDILPI